MLNGPTHKPVRDAGERAGRDELGGCQHCAVRPRRGHALIDVPLGEDALCIFERAKLNRNADSDAQERGKGSLNISISNPG